MAFIARRFLIALGLAAIVAAPALAQKRTAPPELAPLAAWAAKSTQQATIDGRVARAIGLNKDGRPVQLKAVTTAYLDGSRSVHLVRGAQGEMLIFSQGKGNQGSWFLTNHAGAMLRAVQWVPTSANPGIMDAAAAGTLFTETKAFWKAQLGTPVR